MRSAGTSLLDRRLLIVTGKGGTGKTSVAAALAVAAARSGRRTAVVEVGHEPVLPPLFGDIRPERGTRNPVDVAPNLATLWIEPEVALAEYLELQLRVKAVVRAILGTSAFQTFLDAAPGWRDLITLGKLWHLERQETDGRARYDLIVVDAPATGHGLSFLAVPNVILDTVRVGPLRRQTDRVQTLLRDPTRTLVVPVSLAEELPARETRELLARLDELGVHIAPIVANALEPPAPAHALSLAARVRALPRGGAPDLAEPDALARALVHRQRRGALQAHWLAELEALRPTSLIRLPALESSIDGPVSTAALADAMVAALTETA